jgi:ankyrin repeat protein
MSIALTNVEDCTPLHFSALNVNLEATKALVERGAPLNNINKLGDTPLFLAACCRNSEVFRYLKGMGADFDCQQQRPCPLPDIDSQQQGHCHSAHIDSQQCHCLPANIGSQHQ